MTHVTEWSGKVTGDSRPCISDTKNTKEGSWQNWVGKEEIEAFLSLNDLDDRVNRKGSW